MRDSFQLSKQSCVIIKSLRGAIYAHEQVHCSLESRTKLEKVRERKRDACSTHDFMTFKLSLTSISLKCWNVIRCWEKKRTDLPMTMTDFMILSSHYKIISRDSVEYIITYIRLDIRYSRKTTRICFIWEEMEKNYVLLFCDTLSDN